MGFSVGISNLPNQRHKIVSRKGANLTVLLVGESGLGKTTFINTLFATSMMDYANQHRRRDTQLASTVSIDIVRASLEEKGFSLALSVIDTPGFGDHVDNSGATLPIVKFIDDQMDAYMLHEQSDPAAKTANSFVDLRVHVCLYFIQPTGHTLKPLDIEAMKQLGKRCNLIPVIAKADTLTPDALLIFKDRVRDCIATHNIQIYSVHPIDAADEPEAKAAQALMAAMPFAVIGSETDVKAPDGSMARGREYLWGTVLVENPDHCDFTLLRDLLIRSHMHDLITSTTATHYETHRSARLAQTGRSDDDPDAMARKDMQSKMKREEEALRKRFTEQVRLEEARFRKWEQKLIADRDRLNKDLETQHKAVKALEESMAVSSATE